jgi:hypothetical protein
MRKEAFLNGFSQPQARPPHLFKKRDRFQDAIKADRGPSRTFPNIGGEVLIRSGVDAKSAANQITD